MRRKIILLIVTFVLLLVVCLYPDTPASNTPVVNDEVESVEVINESSRAVMKIVHTMEKNNQIVTKSASAVILHETDTHYYAITNYHVLTKEEHNTASVDMFDYLGNRYQASIVSLNQAQVIISEIYDLGLIKFEKGSSNYLIPEFRENGLNLTSLLTAVGYPSGQRSTTSGYYINESNIEGFEFNLIAHNAPIDNGNSGGALFDSNGKLVGINVLGIFDNNDQLVQSYAIPGSKVLEYLELFKL